MGGCETCSEPEPGGDDATVQPPGAARGLLSTLSVTVARSRYAGSIHHVLVVEDDDDIRGLLAELLHGEGLDVVAVRNGREALEELHHAPLPCVILLDLMMPVMDAFAFRAEQRRDPLLERIPVVLLSAVANAARARELGAVAFLRKPADLDDILDAATSHCNQPLASPQTGSTTA